jgi:hypothetical protein
VHAPSHVEYAHGSHFTTVAAEREGAQMPGCAERKTKTPLRNLRKHTGRK